MSSRIPFVRFSTTNQDLSLIGVVLTSKNVLSMDGWMPGKCGRLQFGGRERHIPGMKNALSTSSALTGFRSTIRSTLNAVMDTLTALYSQWRSGYGHSKKAGHTKIICRISRLKDRLVNSRVSWLDCLHIDKCNRCFAATQDIQARAIAMNDREFGTLVTLQFMTATLHPIHQEYY